MASIWRRKFEQAIQENPSDLSGILNRIDEYHISGRLTDLDRVELVDMARKAAQPQLDMAAEVQQLWAAVRDLQEELAAIKGSVIEDGSSEVGPDGINIAEYQQPTGVHDAYFAGDLVRWHGEVYECIAPEGVACVWAPDTMPGYWELVAIGGAVTDGEDDV